MRRKSMVLIVIAAGCGLVASIGISQVLDSRSGGGAEVAETVDIYVTNTHIAITDVITPQMVSLEPWPKDRVPDGSITDLQELVDRRPQSPLFKGEPILKQKLVDPNDMTGAADRIPKGFRALPVKVTAEMTSGLVQPGDRVDVLMVLRESGAIRKTVAKTILENIPVFAVNEHIERKTDTEGNVIQARTVTLQVTPAQVEILTLASRIGELSLSIRSPGDLTTADQEGTDIRKLLGASETVEEPRPADRQGFSDFVRNMGQSQMPPAPLPAADGPTMVIYEPEGVRWYEFGPDGDKPREVTPLGEAVGQSEAQPGANDENKGPADEASTEEMPDDLDSRIDEEGQGL